jgi:hypothetical protein
MLLSLPPYPGTIQASQFTLCRSNISMFPYHLRIAPRIVIERSIGIRSRGFQEIDLELKKLVASGT